MGTDVSPRLAVKSRNGNVPVATGFLTCDPRCVIAIADAITLAAEVFRIAADLRM